jgi:hypothetical protein
MLLCLGALFVLQSVSVTLTWGSCWGGLAGDPVFQSCAATPTALDLAIYRASYGVLLALGGLTLAAFYRPRPPLFTGSLVVAAWFAAEGIAGIAGASGFTMAWLMLPAAMLLALSGVAAMRPLGAGRLGRWQRTPWMGMRVGVLTFGLLYVGWCLIALFLFDPVPTAAACAIAAALLASIVAGRRRRKRTAAVD